MTIYEDRLIIPVEPARLFDFLLRPANVARVTDPATGLTLVDAPEVVDLGSRITFRVNAFGQISEAVHEITHLEPQITIIEEQRVGPMKWWRHTHAFEADASGAVLIERVEFDPPGGLVGLLVTADRIIERLEDSMAYREQALRRLADRGEI